MLRFRSSILRRTLAAFGLLCLVVLTPGTVSALGSPDPEQSNSFGVEGRISSPAPTQAATIVTPSNGQVFTSTPITVSGLCKSGLLVKVFSNNVFVGSVTCTNGSYSLKVDLFSGQNDIVARVYDSLDQAGPDSNVVSVRFNDAQYAQFGTRTSLSSNYARRGANPGAELSWPIILSGGNGPYAVSVDWGDGSEDSLLTVSFPGEFTIKHIYATAGVYNIVVKATDKNSSSAYLQLVGIANGEAGTNINTGTTGTTPVSNTPSWVERLGWWILAILMVVMVAAFWLGRRHELYVVRKRIERSRTEA
jgi:hypothetical protein